MALQELSPDQIAQLRSNTKQPGAYRAVIAEFLGSGMAGADVTSSFPGRKVSSVVTALKKYANSAEFSGQVQVFSDGETVALVRTSA